MLHEGAVAFAQVLGSDGTSFAKARGAESVASIARTAAAHLIEAAAKASSGEAEAVG